MRSLGVSQDDRLPFVVQGKCNRVARMKLHFLVREYARGVSKARWDGFTL
jgi:hypothetical protein